jgi:hypothetical protein
MSEQREAVVLVDRDANGGPVFDIVVTLPDSTKLDDRCTERQLAAATRFYCDDFSEGLSWSQAHALLSYREYAQECAIRIYPDKPHQVILLFARLIAAHISSRPVLAEYARSRSGRRFRAGTDRALVVRTKYFSEVNTFCTNIMGELARRGIVL